MEVKHIVVGRVRDFPPGSSRLVDVDGAEIGVFNVKGTYYALRSSCPHQGAPLCRGRVIGTNISKKTYEREYAREGEIIKCPWHGWEFEISSGRSIFNPHKVRARAYEVTVESADDEDPSIPTYPVTVERGVVVVHVPLPIH